MSDDRLDAEFELRIEDFVRFCRENRDAAAATVEDKIRMVELTMMLRKVKPETLAKIREPEVVSDAVFGELISRYARQHNEQMAKELLAAMLEMLRKEAER